MNDMITYVQMAQRGEEEGFLKLYGLFYKKAFYTALKISNYCDADAQDIVQDTFMEVHRSIHNLKDPKNFKAWMIRILISKSSHKFRDNRDLFVEPEKFLRMAGHQEHRSYMLPGIAMKDEGDKKVLLAMMDQLKPKLKIVLILQYYENLSIKEMADVLEIPEGTVKTRIMYAKNQLKKLINDYEDKEGRKLGFYSDTLGAMIASSFLMEFQTITLPNSFSQPKAKKPKLQQALTSSISIGVCAVTVVVMAAASYSKWKEMYSPVKEANQDTLVQETKQKIFEPVVYQGITITNCRDAYYTLKEWARNPLKMKERTMLEIEEITPVYLHLKAYEGVYYEKLVKENWVSTFEAMNRF